MKKKLMWIVWPSFLMASVLELVVFAFVDPQDLHWVHGGEPISRQAAYTLGFFVFWTATLITATLTSLLAMSAEEVNRLPASDTEHAGL